MNEPPYAEDVNYWKTGKSAPDVWIEKAIREIASAGGEVRGEGFGREASTGRAAFMLSFDLGGERFKIVWPVLPTRRGEEYSARRQAATILFYDVKARCLSAKVLGARAAFLSFLLLPDGRTAAQLAAPELMEAIPRILAGDDPPRLTGPGD